MTHLVGADAAVAYQLLEIFRRRAVDIVFNVYLAPSLHLY